MTRVRDSVIIAGSVAQKPHQAGHTWQFLQYLLGFRRLGWEVLLLDRLEPEMCIDTNGQRCAVEESVNLAYLRNVMERFGLGNDFALFYDRGEQVFGRSRAEVRERTRGSDVLLNFMGFFDDEEILAAAPLRVFLDTDPGFGQMWQDLGLATMFTGHDRYVTIGENIGRADCAIPTCGIDWITTKQPVVLDEWTALRATAGGERFTSVGAWRGPYGSVEYHGRTYGLRVHEFRKFLELPRLSGASFEVALDIHTAEVSDLQRLRENGWVLADPQVVAQDPDTYRSYIWGSKAELMIARNIYVQANSGWFSERSMCYLAAGRPVLAQDTGIRNLYSTGAGLLTFSTLDEALDGVEEISRDHQRHCRAARAIAEEYFDSDRVLPALVAKLGVT